MEQAAEDMFEEGFDSHAGPVDVKKEVAPWPLQPNALGLIGQDALIETIDELITYCRDRAVRLPDRVFSGMAGGGKSSLSRAIAHRLGSECLLLNGADLNKPAVMMAALADHGLFSDTKVNGAYSVLPAIIFVDEAHAAGKAFTAFLLSAMDDVRMTTFKGDRYDFGRVTFILATTDAGRLPMTLKSRAAPIYLRPYSLDELASIVWFHGKKALDGYDLPRAVCEEIAARMRANPRRSVRALVECVIPHAHCRLPDRGNASPTLHEIAAAITPELVARYYNAQGIDLNGLDESARAVLRYLDKHGVSPESRLIAAMGITTRNDFLETDEYLTRLGLIAVSTRGRQLTAVGRRYLRTTFSLRHNIAQAATSMPAHEEVA